MWTLRRNVECPSLSPDGTRIAFKERVAARGDGRLHVLDLRALRDWQLAERRSSPLPAALGPTLNHRE